MSNDKTPAADRGSECNDLLGPLPEPDGQLFDLRTPRGKPPFRYFETWQMHAERWRCYELGMAAEREQIAAHLSALGLDDAAQDVLLRSWPNAPDKRPACRSALDPAVRPGT